MRKTLILIFCFLCFAPYCFAYSIDLYSKGTNLPSQRILNLVFCSLHYQDKETFLKDIDSFIVGLSKVKTFDELVHDIGFYCLILSKKNEDLIFKETTGIPPLKVRQDFLDALSRRFKNIYKLIILDARGSVSCAELSSPVKLSLIILGRNKYPGPRNLTKGFLHELGHSLGLRDEGLNSEAALCPPGPPNCAATKNEAVNWWGNLAVRVSRVNYINGCCGNIDYFRPTIASLMNDPDKAEDFGPVNERYLNQTLQTLYRTPCDTDGYK